MPAAKTPVLFIPCPLCSTYPKKLCECYTIYCSLPGDDSVLATWLCTTVTLLPCTLTGEVS